MIPHPAGALDTARPNVARMTDYYLGGKDHYLPDRRAAEELQLAVPSMEGVLLAGRGFLGRAVRHLAQTGIRQFLDLGCGLPTFPILATHELARRARADARVVYADVDQVVARHAEVHLTEPGVQAVEGDIRDMDTILEGQDVIDLSQPVAVLCGHVLDFVADDDLPDILNVLRGCLAAGSALVVSHACTQQMSPAAAAAMTAVYAQTTMPIRIRGRERIAELFEGFPLDDGRLVEVSRWRPDPITLPREHGFLLGGVGVRRI